MNKKRLTAAIACVTAFVGVTAFCACGGGEGTENKGKVATYVMEAEYTEMANVKGTGISSDQAGYEMIYGEGTEEQKSLGWSAGYFVGYTYTTDFSMDFKFTADKAEKATIVLRLGSELGNITLSPDSFAVTLNGGTPISYSSIYIEGSELSEMKFYDKTVATNVTLKEGENVINVKVLANNLRNGQTGGPVIDCLKIQTSAKLTYTENTENPNLRGAI